MSNAKPCAGEDVQSNGLDRICRLCGYRAGLHVVPTTGVWAETPTGLWCPSDHRVPEHLRHPPIPEVTNATN